MVPWLSMVYVKKNMSISTKSWGIWEFWEIIYPVVGSPLIIFFYLYASCQHHIINPCDTFPSGPFLGTGGTGTNPKEGGKGGGRFFQSRRRPVGYPKNQGELLQMEIRNVDEAMTVVRTCDSPMSICFDDDEELMMMMMKNWWRSDDSTRPRNVIVE